MDILSGLNPAQKEAVETIEGPLLIIAGPGSGKTRVITHRIAYLVKVCGINPRRIMAVTFTNKAAREMKERLLRLMPSSAEALTMGTFHAFCARLLRQESKALGLDSNFVIYDDEDQLNLLKRCLQEVGIDSKQSPPRVFQSAISAAKSKLLSPQDYVNIGRSYFEEKVGRVYERYQELLAQSKALDFDDLLMKAVILFRQHPEIIEKHSSRYIHVLIDEFQDTNLAQYELARQLASKHRNICVVGDPDQSIYSWRFADLRNILHFEKDFPDAKVVMLEQNYRSTKTILEVASHIIAANQQRKPKALWTENEKGVPITLFEAYDEQEEAQFIAQEAEHLTRQGEASWGDLAVMYRTNAQSRILEETFLRYGIPHKLVGATRFYQRREIKDILAYLRLLLNHQDAVSLARIINIPGRGIGQKSLEELSRWAKGKNLSLYSALELLTEGKETHSFTPRLTRALKDFLKLIEELTAKSQELSLVELLDLVLEHTGYKDYVLGEEDGEERWDNLLELRTVVKEYESSPPQEALASFLEGVALVSDVDDLEEKAKAVTLITLHQAKGLEFPIVFIVGMEEGILPHFRSFDDPAQMEEECRLCYVGVTRAQKRLYLVRSFRRSLMGASKQNPPSRYLSNIPTHLIATPSPEEMGKTKPEAQAFPQPSHSRLAPAPLKAGDHIRHTSFGDGVVVSCTSVKDDQEITVAFPGLGVKRLLLSLAPLEKIATAKEE